MMRLSLLFALIISSTLAHSQIPKLLVTNLDDENWRIDDYVSSSTHPLISFWADYSTPSALEYDSWVSHADTWRDSCDVDIYCLHLTTSFTDSQDVIDMFDVNNWAGELLFTKSSAAGDSFGFIGFPHLYLYDNYDDLVYEHGFWSLGDDLVLDSFIQAELCPAGNWNLSVGENEDDYVNFRSTSFGLLVRQPIGATGILSMFAVDGRLLQSSELIHTTNNLTWPDQDRMVIVTYENATVRRSRIIPIPR